MSTSADIANFISAVAVGVAIVALLISGAGIFYTRTQVQYLKKQFQIDYQPIIRFTFSPVRVHDINKNALFLVTLENPSQNRNVEVTECSIYFREPIQPRLFKRFTIGAVNSESSQMVIVGMDKAVKIAKLRDRLATELNVGIETFIKQHYPDTASVIDQAYHLDVIVKYQLEVIDRNSDPFEKRAEYTLIRRKDGWEIQDHQEGATRKEQRLGVYVGAFYL